MAPAAGSRSTTCWEFAPRCVTPTCSWVGADTLALVGQGRMGFLDIGSDADPRYVFGGP